MSSGGTTLPAPGALLPRTESEHEVAVRQAEARTDHPSGALRYRPEIDGLRAVAVIIVILYHAGFRKDGVTLFGGGFVGVDVFLVISGYLIGSILLREIQEGRMRFLTFYERRARRILPALYAVLLATVPLAWLIMLPGAMKDHGIALSSAVASASNIFFWHEVSYDAAENLANPLIHTWSLGLEEQFYLVFPALLLICHRFARRHMAMMLAGLCGISLLLAEYMTAQMPDASFFLLPARFWELGVGALLALAELRGTAPASSSWRAALGLAAILICVPLMRVNWHHPGLATILPVGGAALLIRYGGRDTPVGALLASRPMAGIGLISYSLYLWHQPVFAFARLYSASETSWTAKLALIALSALLAMATFRLVEKPTRDRKRVSSRTIWAIAIGGALLLGTSGALIYREGGFPGRFPGPLTAIAKAERIEEAAIAQNGKGCLNYVPALGPCSFTRPGLAGAQLILAGDSHARTLSGSMIAQLADGGPIGRVTLLNRGGCLMLLGVTRVDGGLPSCPESYNRDRMRFLLSHPHSVVVLMMRWPVLLEQSRFDNGAGGVEPGASPHIAPGNGPFGQAVSPAMVQSALRATVAPLLKAGLRVVLVYPVPEMGWNIPRKLLEESRDGRGWLSPSIASVSLAQFHARSRQSYALLDSLGDHPGLLRIYPEQSLCRDGRCYSHRGERIFYRDDNHLTRAGADLVAEAIVKGMAARWGPFTGP